MQGSQVSCSCCTTCRAMDVNCGELWGVCCTCRRTLQSWFCMFLLHQPHTSTIFVASPPQKDLCHHPAYPSGQLGSQSILKISMFGKCNWNIVKLGSKSRSKNQNITKASSTVPGSHSAKYAFDLFHYLWGNAQALLEHLPEKNWSPCCLRRQSVPSWQSMW